MSNAEIKDVRLARYEATGFYYIDDDSEDEASDALAERYLEYFFFFDDGGEFVWYLPEAELDNFVFDHSNHSLMRRYKEVSEGEFRHRSAESQAEFYRPWLCREYGIENVHYPK
ncbi:Uncharacterised protein [Porphyromonas crevioricanis]|uniref:Uncharacterized protein n=2 Tax=Porphyromonas crevioricanis TaxID=393921 RepID=A0A2X4SE97_9PORP|nr:hypothetical protein [Porphyromonas crevioricanis]GAD07914.1 hypothetical protein PORCAN_1543 [Porphyromonas crevioricanis JCM 13913]SQH72372.1 Uncharacterised protein [Porphyromonas crevioricanis]